MKNIIKQLDLLLSLPAENEVVEWKEAKTNFDFKELGKCFSALSNETNLKNKNSAWLIFGIKNNKQIIGTSYRKDLSKLNSLKHEIAQQTINGIFFVEIYEAKKNGKRVIIFEIPPAPRGIPTAWQGHYYARDNESLVPLSIEKIERIRSQAKLEDWSSQICDGAKIKDLDPIAIQKAREGFSRKNPKLAGKEIGNWSDEIFLNKAKITINSEITRTAIVLLGKSESEHFINPANAKISWILKNKDGVEKDYEHFSCPLILAVDNVYKKIRNLRYRYISDRTLFPDEIDRYDPATIREAINNCIAHQDYELGGKINVVENEDDNLVFSNLGSFIPGTIENVIESDSPSEYYRNKFLTDAMVNVNMIDTIGSGIKKMFISQKNRFFPLPEYDLTGNKVKLVIIGKVLDVKYARKLVQIPDLDLKTIIALDKVQKRKELSSIENKKLRNRGLIEGRSPNLYISSMVASRTGEKSEYIKMRGFKDDHYKKMILEYLEKYKTASKNDIEKLIVDILPRILDEQQKKNKIRNIVYAMSKKDRTIVNTGTTRYPKWSKV
ncbi:MAG: transcriptional regulator [Candidatus Moranbacteria bacterium GW2011_GWC1_45_18]|nr:MAG: transcriptional regulator [Candidatus Moranbacteria bacterium GW2011_GWC2_40_12]KKT33763.1 MAG: transcriptional regulator [Candidatus Moranbacteria bacterium GW2011_GWF2_44_10]KKU00863.1 MAG: transcriptional regulator [Candidatus Moranbacteria bacterium GW2011_GWC1_45_18]OGI23437.1 MAG: transcriptional regulator [Candidatus Moranbacteria bacterium RIFOXYA1_FULL_44_8]OGI36974.1 MAG: transcriptional regulator [Candidatus Moranbacteria bacterium RIFOXYC1_FULL_44_8]OGI39199.1 MAG: transcri